MGINSGPNEGKIIISDGIIIPYTGMAILRKMRKVTEIVDDQSTVEEVLNVDEQKNYGSTDGVVRCNILYDTSKLTNAGDRIEFQEEIIEQNLLFNSSQPCMYYIN